MTQIERMAAIVAKVGGDAYAGQSFAEVAAALNAPDSVNEAVTVYSPTPSSTALAVILAAGDWAKVEMGADGYLATNAPPSDSDKTVIGLCKTVSKALTLGTLSTDRTDYRTVIETVLDDLQTATILQSSTVTSLKALYRTSVHPSWADLNADAANLGPILPDEIKLALGPASDWGGS